MFIFDDELRAFSAFLGRNKHFALNEPKLNNFEGKLEGKLLKALIASQRLNANRS